MAEKYILALDQGTTSSRAVLLNSDAEIVAISQYPFTQHYPRPGWVEHDPLEIWSTQLMAVRDVLSGVSSSQIVGLGLTNQRETVVMWERATGRPLHRAIVWQCRRTSGMCDQLKEQGHEAVIGEKTGLVCDAYFSATKIRWLLDNVAGAREMAAAGQLAVGTVDSWLIWQLSGGRLHVSDPSNASRTLLYNIKTLDWDDQLLSLFDIPRSILPEIVPSSGVIGKTTLFGDEIAIAGLAGDQQAALFGQGCYSPATAKNTYGTGCFVLLNTGQEIVHSKNRLLTTVAWQLEGKPVCYALEGSVFIAGAAVGWLRDGLKIIDSADETTALAASVEDSGGVYFVPAFVGLGSPYWDQYARGTIIGITRGTTRAHIVRATLESIAYQTRDLLEALKSDTGYKISELRVDGGAAVNDLLLQMQADILGVDVVRPKIIESTVAGAGFLAGIATNFWDMSQLTELTTTTSAHFKPVREQKIREAGYKKWLKAVERAAKWVEEEEFN